MWKSIMNHKEDTATMMTTLKTAGIIIGGSPKDSNIGSGWWGFELSEFLSPRSPNRDRTKDISNSLLWDSQSSPKVFQFITVPNDFKEEVGETKCLKGGKYGFPFYWVKSFLEVSMAIQHLFGDLFLQKPYPLIKAVWLWKMSSPETLESLSTNILVKSLYIRFTHDIGLMQGII